MMWVFIEYCLYDAYKLVLSGKFPSAMDLLPKEEKQTQKLKGEFLKLYKGEPHKHQPWETGKEEDIQSYNQYSRGSYSYGA